MTMTTILDILFFEEGFRSKPYLCNEGYVTIGWGTKLYNKKNADPNDFPITISRKLGEEWLEAEVTQIIDDLIKSRFGYIFEDLNNDRQIIIISMGYQMGVSGVLGFKKMWEALDDGDWEEAAKEALDSRWAAQTENRAKRHARVIAGEDLDDVYDKYIL